MWNNEKHARFPPVCADKPFGEWNHLRIVMLGERVWVHLNGKLFEPIIPQTVDALRQFHPRLLMPCHCTGWKATQALSIEFPDTFVPTSVGTTLVITALPEGPST